MVGNFRVATGNPVVFTLQPPECYMEIRYGYGTTGTRVAGPVRVGDPLTLIIYMRSKYGTHLSQDLTTLNQACLMEHKRWDETQQNPTWHRGKSVIILIVVIACILWAILSGLIHSPITLGKLAWKISVTSHAVVENNATNGSELMVNQWPCKINKGVLKNKLLLIVLTVNCFEFVITTCLKTLSQ